MSRYVEVRTLPPELQEVALRRVRRGLPEPRPSVPLCPHTAAVHVIERDGTVWCRTCTAEAA